MTRGTTALVVCALLAAAGPTLAGPDWIEHGDAGSLVSTAQITFGTGQLDSISGGLTGGARAGDFEDVYLIRVTDPLLFSIQSGSGDFDPVLWIFNVSQANQAFGLLANDNTPTSNFPHLTAFATDGTGAALTKPGVYAVAVSGAGRYPVSNGGAIYFFANSTEVSGADGPGGILPHIGWAGEGQTGNYLIQTEGIGFHSAPAPGTAALLGLGGLLLTRRRR
jgi:MYXO-CTERM domain-containing protein